VPTRYHQLVEAAAARVCSLSGARMHPRHNVHVQTLVALLAGLGLAAFDDLIALTVGTEHRDKYHHDLFHERMSVWHQ
jgi:hypothetical protein